MSVLGYSPYRQPGAPKGSLLIGFIALIGGAAVVAGLSAAAGSDESAPTAASAAPTFEIDDSIAALDRYSPDYAMGYMMGQAQRLISLPHTAEAVCLGLYREDDAHLRASGASLRISETDYRQGCQDAFTYKEAPFEEALP